MTPNLPPKQAEIGVEPTPEATARPEVETPPVEVIELAYLAEPEPEPEIKEPEEPPPPSFGEIASKIFDTVPKGKVLAFVDFTSSSGEVTKLSQAIFQEIEPIMIIEGLKKNISFIERKDLKLLLDEWDLKSIYQAGGDSGAQVLLGADYIMTGRARLSRDEVQCVLKLVDLQNGSIVGMVKAGLEAEPDFYTWEKTKPLDNKAALPNESNQSSGPNLASSQDSKVSIWTKKKTYKVGEKIKIFFEVKEPLYVEIIDVTPEGDITTIFPNPDQTDSHCMPGKVYTIPPENGSFELVITPPTGLDRLKVLANPSPFSSNVNLKTRGITFTKNMVRSAPTRTNLAFEIE